MQSLLCIIKHFNIFFVKVKLFVKFGTNVKMLPNLDLVAKNSFLIYCCGCCSYSWIVNVDILGRKCDVHKSAIEALKRSSD